MKFTKGTPEHFENALKNKIKELGGDVEACDKITSAAYMDSYAKERYIHNLIGDVESAVIGLVKGIDWESDDKALSATFQKGNTVFEISCPLTDLTFNDLDKDCNYLVNAIKSAGKVEECEAINASEDDDFDGNDFQKYVNLVLKKLKGYGLNTDDPEVYDYAEDAAEMIAQDDDHDVEYWWRETLSNYRYELDEMMPHEIKSATNTSGIAAKPDFETVTSSSYDSDVTYDLVDRKNVEDSDGLLTQYSWYKTSDGNNVFVFGDPDIYLPEDEDFDWETEDDDAAREWFDNYEGFADDDDEYDDDGVYGHW